jgi:hypothetical protein
VISFHVVPRSALLCRSIRIGRVGTPATERMRSCLRLRSSALRSW